MPGPQMLDAALGYAERGWPVFPCRTDKRPYVKHGVLEATTNKDKITRWWEKWPRANIGVDVGEAGMIAVDIDPGYDDSVELPETELVQRTPRGGTHLFYAKSVDEVIPPSESKVAPHLDIRSFHSYVLLPPSRTKDGDYQWLSEGMPTYRPQSLVDAARRVTKKRSDRHDDWIIEPDLEENVAQCVAWLRNEAGIAVEGMNGDSRAYATAAMCKSFGVSQHLALELMWEHWNPRCEPPWGPDEVEHLERKVENGYSYNTSPPGNITRAYRVAKQAEMFKPVSRDTSTGGKETEVGRFRFVDEAGVEAIADPEWLVPGLVSVGSYALLVGQRASYKTFVALDVALSVATGGASWFEDPKDWRGAWPDVKHSGPVLFAAGEGRAGLRSRLSAWRSYHVDGERTGNFYLVDPVPYPNEEDTEAFVRGALALQPDGYELLVMDTLGRSMQGLNENSQQDASTFTRMIQYIQRELDCAVLVLHHTGHSDSAKGRARGSSVLGADVDAEFIIERADKNLVRIHNTKQKDAPEWETPRLVQMVEHEGSLVAARAEEKRQREEKPVAPEEIGAKPKSTGGGRKSRREMEVEIDVVRKAAYQVLKKYPNKEWSKAAFAEAIAAQDTIEVAAGTIRNRYLELLLTDKTHPVAACFDVGTRKWCYRPPKREE